MLFGGVESKKARISKGNYTFIINNSIKYTQPKYIVNNVSE